MILLATTNPTSWLDWAVPTIAAVGIAWAGRAERRGNQRRAEDDRRHSEQQRAMSGLSQQLLHLDGCVDSLRQHVRDLDGERGFIHRHRPRRW